jgi:hypothetical protein
MLLLFYFLILLLIAKFFWKSTPANILLYIYIFSLVCGIFVWEEYLDIENTSNILNTMFVGFVLSFFIISWHDVDYRASLIIDDVSKLEKFSSILIIVNALIFLILSISAYYSFSVAENYSAVKNSGETSVVFDAIPLPSFLILFSIYLTPTSYFLPPISFYYFVRNNWVKGLLSMLFSTNIFLQGIIVFSRSGMISFVFLYIFYLPLFYWRINKEMKKYINSVIGLLSIAGIGFFLQISLNRFEKELKYQDLGYGDSIKSNPVIFSIFDYASQWYINSLKVMQLYSYDILYGQLSFPFPLLILDRLGVIDYPSGKIVSNLISIWGDKYDKFNGIVANLLFDFSHFGVILFCIIYYSAVGALAKKRNGSLIFYNVITMGPLFVLAATGIFNYEMKSVYFNLLLVYVVLVRYILSRPNKIQSVKI